MIIHCKSIRRNKGININFLLTLFPAVIPSNKEVLSGTEGVEISCIVSGLLAALKTVNWKNSDDAVVKTLSGYVIHNGTFEGDTQTTSLKVPGDQISADSTYTCHITTSNEDVKTANVNLNIFSEYRVVSVPVSMHIKRFVWKAI